MTFDDALRIARGCTSYGGGHRSDPEKFEVYQHGIRTVIRALEAEERAEDWKKIACRDRNAFIAEQERAVNAETRALIAEDEAQRMKAALLDVDEQCEIGVLPCPRCGREERMDDLDIRLTIRAALKEPR